MKSKNSRPAERIRELLDQLEQGEMPNVLELMSALSAVSALETDQVRKCDGFCPLCD